jgi:tagatose 1,6-diphosphate aldolase GatY/KbaY
VRDRGTATLRAAYEQGWAIGAFSTYTQEITQAICLAAKDAGRPVIVQAGASAFTHAGLHQLAAQAVLAADLAEVPVGVHLDHSRDLAQIRACLEAGYTSVMVDGSHLPFDENVALTRATVEAAAPYGAWVEAELGAIPGDEDRSQHAAAGELTDPARAEELVARTGVDALAVAVGNVHGTAAEPRPLDLELLARLRAVVPVPLVLHGASGLPVHELDAARRLGVAKVNVNTELRHAFLAALAEALPDVRPTADVATALGRGRDAVRAVVHRTILALHDTPSVVPGPPR